MKRLMIRLGIHGKAHKKAEAKLIAFMHNNGIGA